MKKLLFAALLCSFTAATAQIQVQQPVVENLDNPIGLDITTPRFSWQLISPKRNVMQSAYELRVGNDPKELARGKSTWSTGKVASDQSLHVPYEGPVLNAGQRYYWQVRVWDNSGAASAWTTPAFWQMGLLKAADWKASWIEPGFVEEPLRPSPQFFRKFTAQKKVKTATAYITAHGLYEAHINNKRVGDAYFTPGWTSYNKRLQYQAYDVTAALQQGQNEISVLLGTGWYRGNFSFGNTKNIYGKDAALLFQLDITYADGTQESIVSDENWKAAASGIRYSEIYAGEKFDARQQQLNKDNWPAVKRAGYSKDVLVATYNEPVKKHEVIAPIRIFKTPKGEQVIDFGQNLAGWVVVKVKGKAGDSITISHAEVLDKAGNFYTENLRSARAQDIYILAGTGEEVFEPHFSWHGFRYIKVDGYPGELTPENFTAVALYSAMKPSGSFTTSNKLVNQLQQNIEWGLKGNFLDVPTDCPQRDERLGWTGDAQVFFRTASYLRDVNNFFDKWMKDVAAEQMPNGSVPRVVPNTFDGSGGPAGWADVATIIPWGMYQVYGDKKILETQYASMKAWVGYMEKLAPNGLYNTGTHYGDWLFYSVNDDRDGRSAITNKFFIAQCFFGHSTQLMINAAKVLGRNEDVTYYTALLQRVKNAFVKEYLTANGATMSNTQTSYVLALQFDMLPENLRQQAADRLVADIRLYRTHLTTGFLGTPYLCEVLSRFGHTDVAYELLLQQSYPSWLYPVTKGATTIWERWDGIKPDGSFQEASMNSFNHYAYGAIGDWMYRVMAGLDIDGDGVGYKKVRIKPHIGGGFTNAAAGYTTRYGKLSSAWRIENDKLLMDIEVPANTTATVYVPAGSVEEVTENGKVLNKDIQPAGREGAYVVLKVGSGSYKFSTPWKGKPAS
ncbi:alpha-L-rhamnosidase [uncultured Chitinophaga sp.]|uniref:alpha-L-rhamnosidase n=1 Tax=uncultured Chitinophaga sp. TaxID=339340 RepID=UPI0025E6F9C0|nr:alpha-L-rhamnosidase [uncultured Chitinophaga sp.]